MPLDVVALAPQEGTLHSRYLGRMWCWEVTWEQPGRRVWHHRLEVQEVAPGECLVAPEMVEYLSQLSGVVFTLVGSDPGGSLALRYRVEAAA